MKKIALLSLLLISFIGLAQVPQGISYQAIALNGSGNPVVSSNVRLRLSILDNSATGTNLFTETHLKTTNPQGLFNLIIGQGTVVSGTFTTINWGTNSKFLKVEMDAAGGTNYVLVGTTQLLSVPYALRAETVSTIPATALSGIGTGSLKSGSFVVIDGNAARGFSNGVWSNQNLTNFLPTSSVVNSNGNFVIIDGNTAKGFSNGVWSTQNLTNFLSTTSVINSNGNFVIIDGNTAKGFSNGVWSTQNLTNFLPTSSVVNSNGDFVIIDGNTVKGLSNGVWSTQNLTNFISTTEVLNSNGNFVIMDGNTIKGFSNGVWSTQNLTNTLPTSSVIKSDKN